MIQHVIWSEAGYAYAVNSKSEHVERCPAWRRGMAGVETAHVWTEWECVLPSIVQRKCERCGLYERKIEE